MDKVIERLERLEAQWMVLNEENSANKVTIKMLEKKLLQSEKKIQELTDKTETSSSESDDDVRNEKRFRVLEKQIIKLDKQQKQQIQDANDKFEKVHKLQHVFNSAILRRATVLEKIELVSSKLDSVSDTVDDLDANKGSTFSQIEELDSRCTSIQEELNDLKSSLPQTSQIQQDPYASTFCPVESQAIPHVEFKATMGSPKPFMHNGMAFNRTVLLLRNEGHGFDESKGLFIAPYRGWYEFKFKLQARLSRQEMLEAGLEVSNPQLGRSFWMSVEQQCGNGRIQGTNENGAVLEIGDQVVFKIKRVEGQSAHITCCCYEGKLIALK